MIKGVKTIVVAIIIFILFGPYIYLSKYIYLSSDDFGRAYYNISTFGDRYYYWVTHENGRYINALVTNLPVYNLKLQRIIPVIFIFLFLFAIYSFLKSLILSKRLFLNKSLIFIISTLVTSHIISALPLTAHFFYWFAASTVYLLPLVGLLFLTSNFIKSRFFGKYFYFNLLLIIICVGSNEMAAAIIGVLILLTISIALIEKKFSFSRKFSVYFLIYGFVLSPLLFLKGTQNRIAYYEEGTNLFHAIFASTYSTLAEMISNFFKIENLLILLLIGLLFNNGKKINLKLNKKLFFNFLLKSALAIFCFWSTFFVLNYSVGRATFNLYRTGNFQNVVFLIVTIYIIFEFFSIFEWDERAKGIINNLNKILILIVLIALGTIHLKSENYTSAVSDIYSGKARNFSRTIEQRLITLKNSEKSNIIFKLIDTPKSIYVDYLFPNPDHTVNMWYVDMINRQFNTQIKTITVRP
tara:strand:- start:6360 stop:7763 length:1404 start_codon:yes stop_codon:yes gene_type:complete